MRSAFSSVTVGQFSKCLLRPGMMASSIGYCAVDRAGSHLSVEGAMGRAC